MSVMKLTYKPRAKQATCLTCGETTLLADLCEGGMCDQCRASAPPFEGHPSDSPGFNAANYECEEDMFLYGGDASA